MFLSSGSLCHLIHFNLNHIYRATGSPRDPLTGSDGPPASPALEFAPARVPNPGFCGLQRPRLRKTTARAWPGCLGSSHRQPRSPGQFCRGRGVLARHSYLHSGVGSPALFPPGDCGAGAGRPRAARRKAGRARGWAGGAAKREAQGARSRERRREAGARRARALG